jgi:hypothetical protein
MRCWRVAGQFAEKQEFAGAPRYIRLLPPPKEQDVGSSGRRGSSMEALHETAGTVLTLPRQHVFH